MPLDFHHLASFNLWQCPGSWQSRAVEHSTNHCLATVKQNRKKNTGHTHTHTQQTNGKQLFLSSLGLVLICLRVFDVQVRGHARKHHPLRSEYRHRAHRRPGCSLRMCCRHITLTTHVGAEGGLSGHTEDLLL